MSHTLTASYTVVVPPFFFPFSTFPLSLHLLISLNLIRGSPPQGKLKMRSLAPPRRNLEDGFGVENKDPRATTPGSLGKIRPRSRQHLNVPESTLSPTGVENISLAQPSPSTSRAPLRPLSGALRASVTPHIKSPAKGSSAASPAPSDRRVKNRRPKNATPHVKLEACDPTEAFTLGITHEGDRWDPSPSQQGSLSTLTPSPMASSWGCSTVASAEAEEQNDVSFHGGDLWSELRLEEVDEVDPLDHRAHYFVELDSREANVADTSSVALAFSDRGSFSEVPSARRDCFVVPSPQAPTNISFATSQVSEPHFALPHPLPFDCSLFNL